MWWWLLAVALSLVSWGVASARRVLYPERHVLPIPDPLPVCTSKTLTASDGRAFDVWRFDAPAPRGRVLVCHGFYANRYQVMGMADGLRQRGYETLLFELRGHGDRPGPCTLGVRECGDAEAVIRWAAARDGARPLPLGAVGFSMGASVVCQLAARTPALQALIADSLYSRLFPILAKEIRQRYALPAIPFVWLTWWSVQLALGRRLSAADPAALAPRLRQSLLAIQGGEDRRVPPACGEEFVRRWAGSVERWVEPEVGHVGMFARDPRAYCDRVAAFFDRTLTGS
ncbi:MAG: alpha/beta fold hydrolase [Candidatus Omnitrophica bacterium]|nr:alpha/beta fold hydrolase [Candidatus Omnitrophota bacterium]